ncbi:nuclear transport factor 2 family protein [Pseudomonas sp. B21-040]|uniref:nuclear transport factor 2 family protein n=1 Tax=Pseudomonas sp. B21-040 TaxID=2895486 RepID=UPI00215F3988|nr:nuclear transport factor 2 family protein [Pseudomonas sp. B21-040]UVL43202.1 nuclear transport factor 2 family protein [Pseudomonas sp. B21-040]
MRLNIAKFYEVVDSGDLEEFSSYLAGDLVFKFGNSPELHGIPEVIEALRGFYLRISGVKHFLYKVIDSGDHTFITCDVQYWRLDGTVLKVPAAVLLRHVDGQISDYRIFVDNSSL